MSTDRDTVRSYDTVAAEYAAEAAAMPRMGRDRDRCVRDRAGWLGQGAGDRKRWWARCT